MVGRVFRAHGIRGELKVIPETDDPARFEALETVFTGPDLERLTPHEVKQARFQYTKRGTTVILQLEDVGDRNAAEQFRKHNVYALEEDLDVADDEVFVDDLLGSDVELKNGTHVGTVEEVLQTPAQHVYVVSRPDAPDALIPHVPEFVLEVDVEERRIVIEPIEGLL